MAMPLANQVGGMVQNQMNTSGLNQSQKTCFECNSIIQTNSLFCSSCGLKQDTSSGTKEEISVPKIICNNCNKEFSTQYKFCPSCGDVYNPCPNCKTDLEANAKICHACEYVLPFMCSCGNQCQPDSKFCSNCGKNLKS